MRSNLGGTTDFFRPNKKRKDGFFMGKFKNVIFDFDSTLVKIEGLDEIARRQGKLASIEQITKAGMDGNLSFNKSLQTRFDLLAPSISDINLLIEDYRKSLVTGAAETVATLQKNGVTVFISTGGIKAAVLPIAIELGIKQEHVFAVCTSLDMHGNLKLKTSCLMTKDLGKTQVVTLIRKSGTTVMIGDGMTDFEAGKQADKFIGFGGIVQRESVKSVSDTYITEPNLYKLLELC